MVWGKASVVIPFSFVGRKGGTFTKKAARAWDRRLLIGHIRISFGTCFELMEGTGSFEEQIQFPHGEGI